jgi:hypothetical protein
MYFASNLNKSLEIGTHHVTSDDVDYLAGYGNAIWLAIGLRLVSLLELADHGAPRVAGVLRGVTECACIDDNDPAAHGT